MSVKGKPPKQRSRVPCTTGGDLCELVRHGQEIPLAARRPRYGRAGAGGGALAGWAICVPQEQASQTRPLSRPPSSSPQRSPSFENALPGNIPVCVTLEWSEGTMRQPCVLEGRSRHTTGHPVGLD